MERLRDFLLGVMVAGLINIACTFYLGRKIQADFSSSIEKLEQINRVDSVIEHYYHDNTILKEKNDSISFKVIDISKEYEKMVGNINQFSADDDYNFFSDYTSRYSNSYNRDSTQDSKSNIR